MAWQKAECGKVQLCFFERLKGKYDDSHSKYHGVVADGNCTCSSGAVDLCAAKSASLRVVRYSPATNIHQPSLLLTCHKPCGASLTSLFVSYNATQHSPAQLKEQSFLTCHEPGGAVGPKLVPEAAEKVQELKRAQACGAGSERLEGRPADKEQHKHHEEAHILHPAPAIPVVPHQQWADRQVVSVHQ